MSQTKKFREPFCEFYIESYAKFGVLIQTLDNVKDLSTDTYVSNGQFLQCFLPNPIKDSFNIKKDEVNRNIMFFCLF